MSFKAKDPTAVKDYLQKNGISEIICGVFQGIYSPSWFVIMYAMGTVFRLTVNSLLGLANYLHIMLSN